MTMHRAIDAAAAEDELRRRFAVRLEPFAHGDFRVELLLPEAADALIDEREFEYDERLPYWAELWPSARALARRLLDGGEPAPTLELGAGLALPSLALLARGVDVLATDYYEDALRFAAVNARRNRLPPLRTRLLDWRRPDVDLGRWPRLIAADVLYERRNVRPLLDAAAALLAPGGRFLLADPGRVHLPGFREQAQRAGWALREACVAEPSAQAPSGEVEIRLLELSRQRPPPNV